MEWSTRKKSCKLFGGKAHLHFCGSENMLYMNWSQVLADFEASGRGCVIFVIKNATVIGKTEEFKHVRTTRSIIWF